MRNIKGFTLIETLLYVAIFAIFVGGMIVFAFAMLTAAQRADETIEVADNARFAMQKIQRAIQVATAVNSPAVGASANSLSLSTATASWNPFIIDVADGSLRFKAGSATAVLITNSFVTVSSVSFFNYSFSTGTKNTMRVQARVASRIPASTASTSIDFFVSIQ